MANRPIAIFYSWQSDLPNNKTRGFIQSCIEAAVKSLRDAVVVDAQRDTDGVPGTPDIVQTIFSRIDECDLFIADVSTVGMYTPENHPDRIKLMPNPNVMLELGYAAKSLDWSNVICLKNTDFDSQGELPFDLAHRRLTGFSLEGNKVADERKRIRDIIASTVMDILEKDARPRNGYAMHTVGSFNWDTEEITKNLIPLDLHRSVRCQEKREEYLSQITSLIDRIRTAVVGTKPCTGTRPNPKDFNPTISEWMQQQKKAVSLRKEEVVDIREHALTLLSIELNDSFFDLGNLMVSSVFGSVQHSGTEEEIQKYHDLHSLSFLFHKLDLMDIFIGTFDSIVLLPLAIQNVSTVADEDISVIIQLNPQETEIVVPSRELFDPEHRSEGDTIGLEGFVYDENLPCIALLMQESAGIKYDSDISYDITDIQVENRRRIMQTLGGNDLRSDVEDYEREICKYIASPINDQLAAYEFTIASLRPNETKWIGPLIALRPNVSQISLTYSIRSVHSDGKITGSLHYTIQ